MKGVHLLKHPLGNNPTVTFTLGNEMEENPPRLTTPRRAALVSARKKMHAIRVMLRPDLKIHACCMAPDTPLRSVKSLRFTPKGTPRSGLIKIKKPAPAVILSVEKPPSSAKIHGKSMSWKIMMILSQGRKREKNWLLKSAGLNV